MALIIEDGTGISGADSFQTLVGLDAFSVAYFDTALGGTDSAKEAALRRAFAFMAALKWRASGWPVFAGVIPAAVTNAQSAFARSELASPGVLSPDLALGQSKTLIAVDSLRWETGGLAATITNMRPTVTMAFDFLRAAKLIEDDFDGGKSALIWSVGNG